MQKSKEIESANNVFIDTDKFFLMSLDLLCIANGEFFLKINPAWKQILGYEEGDLLGKPFLSYVHPDDIEATLNEVLKLRQGKKTVEFENRYRCKNGSYKWLSWSTSPDTKTGLLYATAHDITELKGLNENLKKKTIELELKNQEVEQFVYVASHDLQEPLRTISNYIYLFQKKFVIASDEESKEYFEFISAATHRMQSQIKGLLNYWQIGNDHKKSEVDLNQVLIEIFNDLKFSINESCAEISINKLPVLKVHSNIKSLFLNLISNALKFLRKEVPLKIEISAKAKGKEYIFSISDNGIGINKCYHKRIFFIFQKLHSIQIYEGTGIGLAYCKKIVEMHGGRIWLKSEPGVGTTFYFTLPK